MHYLITGHTGFKGSWLSLMLERMGHTVSGIALDAPEESLYNQAKLHTVLKNDFRIDIRDRVALLTAITKVNPEVIVHLAAQSLVGQSYRIPVETFDVNVLGTLNVLEATRKLKDLKAVLVITTDKVYKNQNHLRGYIEEDELGGDDPYSASKAAADIAAQSWIKSFANIPIAIARAGNVIGGGDWAQDRLIPDLVKAYSIGKLPILRNPHSIRPWQHVLDCLNGYLCLVDKQLANGFSGEWNFGPDPYVRHTVGDLVVNFAEEWGIGTPSWELKSSDSPKEANYLLLDSSKARTQLDWADKLDFVETIRWTVNFYKQNKLANLKSVMKNQVQEFLESDKK